MLNELAVSPAVLYICSHLRGRRSTGHTQTHTMQRGALCSWYMGPAM